MNNEAFQAMVRDRGQSTKEFARAVVEAEFKKKRKSQKRKHDGYSSDSGDEDDKKPKKKGHQDLLRPTQVKGPTKETKEEHQSQQYRDRAKERREGGSGGDPSSMAVVDPDISLPSARKGLDMTLVREERGKLMQMKDNNMSKGSGDHELLDPNGLQTADESQYTMSQFLKESNTLSPEISRYVMDLLDSSKKNLNKKIVCGLEGKILQRTRLIMNALGHPSDRRRAWEVPREIVHSTTQEEYHASPPLSEEMLQEIDRAFPTKQERNESATSATELEPAKSTSKIAKEEDSVAASDEDGDIFDGLDDYVPPKPP